jgi:hypothetical protein
MKVLKLLLFLIFILPLSSSALLLSNEFQQNLPVLNNLEAITQAPVLSLSSGSEVFTRREPIDLLEEGEKRDVEYTVISENGIDILTIAKVELSNDKEMIRYFLGRHVGNINDKGKDFIGTIIKSDIVKDKEGNLKSYTEKYFQFYKEKWRTDEFHKAPYLSYKRKVEVNGNQEVSIYYDPNNPNQVAYKVEKTTTMENNKPKEIQEIYSKPQGSGWEEIGKIRIAKDYNRDGSINKIEKTYFDKNNTKIALFHYDNFEFNPSIRRYTFREIRKAYQNGEEITLSTNDYIMAFDSSQETSGADIQTTADLEDLLIDTNLNNGEYDFSLYNGPTNYRWGLDYPLESDPPQIRNIDYSYSSNWIWEVKQENGTKILNLKTLPDGETRFKIKLTGNYGDENKYNTILDVCMKYRLPIAYTALLFAIQRAENGQGTEEGKFGPMGIVINKKKGTDTFRGQVIFSANTVKNYKFRWDSGQTLGKPTYLDLLWHEYCNSELYRVNENWLPNVRNSLEAWWQG